MIIQVTCVTAYTTRSLPAPQPPETPEQFEKRLVSRLYEIMKAADMSVTSEKMLRNQLASEFKIEDIGSYKSLIKQHAMYFIENIDDKDTLQPLGYEEPGAAKALSKYKPPQARGVGAV